MTKVKFFVLLLATTILMLVFPGIVNAATIEAKETTKTSTGKTVTWNYELDSNNNILNLKCTNISSISGELEIPSQIDGHTVITIGNTVNTYSEGAFEGCPGLTGITIPNTVTTIGYRAFYNCTGLKKLTLPNSVTKIGEGSFAYCSGITSVTLSKNLSSIGKYAFQNCTGMKSITLPESLTSIGNYALQNCTGLAKITIPNSVTSIGSGAFEKCSGLKEITLSNNLTKIADLTFNSCSGLTSIKLPESITTIEGGYSWMGAFGKCSNLAKILIPDSVATIGENAFVDCKKLTIYGNDGQASKSYAEANGINFKYISQWDESDVGDDITPPSVESILVPYSNVSDYYDSNSTTYIVPSGKVLIINVNFNENILATEVPALTIKFGNGANIVLKEGTVSGSTIAYSYTIGNTDIGTMTAVSLSGGNVSDVAGNKATLNCPELYVQFWNHYIYANGTAIDVEDGNNNNNNNNNNNSNTTTDNKKPSTGNNTTGGTSNTKPKEDPSTYPGTLPKTGIKVGIISTIAILVIVSGLVYFKSNKLKDI